MPIVGDRPSEGLRVVLERDRDESPPWKYEGAVFTPSATRSVRATVTGDGAVDVTLEGSDGDVEPDLADRVRLIVRTAYKQAVADGEGVPARRLVRWRPDRAAAEPARR
jgi:hypothetical protein